MSSFHSALQLWRLQALNMLAKDLFMLLSFMFFNHGQNPGVCDNPRFWKGFGVFISRCLINSFYWKSSIAPSRDCDLTLL